MVSPLRRVSSNFLKFLSSGSAKLTTTLKNCAIHCLIAHVESTFPKIRRKKWNEKCNGWHVCLHNGGLPYDCYTVWEKNPPRFSDIFSQMAETFLSKFYMPIISCYLLLNYSFLFTYLQLWQSYAQPSSSHRMLKMSTIGRNARCRFLTFFPNRWEFLVQIVHAYYMFLSTLQYKFLFNYLQLWQSCAILSATTQRAFWPYVYSMCWFSLQKSE